MERVSKHNYYLDIAQTVSERATCMRRRFGAIIVKNDVIISTGYNGAPRGRQNRTDIGIRVTVEGQTFVLTGDSTEEQFRVATARYGDYLKSDFLQLAHHGSGNGLGMHNLYTTVDATVVFHPRMHRLDEDTYGIGTNEKLALQKAELVIRSGNYGTATLILPFKVGDKIESTKTPIDESHTYME